MWLWVILISILTTGIFAICHMILNEYRQRKKFESKGFKYFGNGLIRLIQNTIKGASFQDDMLWQYEILKKSGKKIGVSRDVGITTFLVSDVDVIKSVLVKDFDHFVDRRKIEMSKSDYLFTKMLFILTGDKWRQLRTKLSPTFTTGKIKRMFKLFEQSGSKFIKFLESEITNSGNEEIDLTEGYSKFTMDIIASTACGIDSQAFNQKEPSLFEQMGQGLQLQFGGKMVLKIIALMLLPAKVSDFIGITFFKKEIQDFFSGTIKSLIKRRVSSGEKGDDFIQLMLEARAGTLKTEENELEAFEKDAMLKDTPGKKSAVTSDLLDDDTIVANSLAFLVAGFDTTQSLLLFCSYSLALHPEIQDKLRTEVDSILEENDGQLTYEGINKMSYLDMVINETLRAYPPQAAIDRGCTTEYKIPGTDYIMKKGEAVAISVIGLHMDPDIYPQPEKFNPERFSPENKSKFNLYTFLPFGQGPRNCIGMRFALTEAKVVLSYLVHHFRIEPSAKTLIPIKFSNTTSLKPEGGMYLRLIKIQ